MSLGRVSHPDLRRKSQQCPFGESHQEDGELGLVPCGVMSHQCTLPAMGKERARDHHQRTWFEASGPNRYVQVGYMPSIVLLALPCGQKGFPLGDFDGLSQMTVTWVLVSKRAKKNGAF